MKPWINISIYLLLCPSSNFCKNKPHTTHHTHTHTHVNKGINKTTINTTPISIISGLAREPVKKKQKYVARNDQNVQEDIDMVHADEGCMWFLESSDNEGKSLGDIYLFISNHSRSYGDMGIVLNVTESVSGKGKPGFEVYASHLEMMTILDFIYP